MAPAQHFLGKHSLRDTKPFQLTADLNRQFLVREDENNEEDAEPTLVLISVQSMPGLMVSRSPSLMLPAVLLGGLGSSVHGNRSI